MGLKRFLKKHGKAGSISRIKESFKGGNFLDPVSTISQELDPGVRLTHNLFRKVTGQDLDPASKVNQNLSNALGTQGKGYAGNKPAHILGLAFTGGGFAAGAGGAGGAGAAGSGAGAGTAGTGAAGAGGVGAGAAGGGAAGVGGASGLGNFLGTYGQYFGPLLSGAGQLIGANQAAKGAEAGIDEIRRQFDIGREDLAPYRVIGTGALNRIGALNGIGPDGQPISGPVDYSAFRASPGYEFNRTEQLRGVENSAAARGGLYSGNALKALQERAAGIADMGYGDYYNRLASLAGIGQTATTTGVQAGANAAGQIAGQQTTIGDIRGSGIAGAGNELANMFDTQYGRAYGRRSPSYGYRG